MADSTQSNNSHPDDITPAKKSAYFSLLVASGIFFVGATQPDIWLLLPDKSVATPIFNIGLPYLLFIVIGPLFLAGLGIFYFPVIGKDKKWRVLSSYCILFLVILALIYKMTALFVPYVIGLVYGVMSFIYVLQLVWRRWGIRYGLASTGVAFALGAGLYGLPIILGIGFDRLRGLQLSQAEMSKLNLVSSDLNGAQLRYAHLDGAQLIASDLGNADLTRADLTGANLVGVTMTNAILHQAILKGANFAAASLSHADLSGIDGDKANFSSHVDKPDLEETATRNMYASYIRGMKTNNAIIDGQMYHCVSFNRATLSGSDFHAMHFENVDWGSANFSGANLVGANFSGGWFGPKEGKLSGSSFSIDETVVTPTMAQWQEFIKEYWDRIARTGGTIGSLVAARFGSADLAGTVLKDANLMEVDFRGAHFDSKTELSGSNVFGAKFTGAEQQGLTCEQLQAAANWEFTFRSSVFCPSNNLSVSGIPTIMPDVIKPVAQWSAFSQRRKDCRKG